MIRVLNTKTNWLQFRTEDKINDLKSYLNVLVKNLEEASDKVSNRLDMKFQQITDEQERAQFEDWAQEEYWDYKETYPRILLNSFHVTSMTLLESELFSIANNIGEKQGQVFKVADITGRDYIGSACKYIKTLTRIDCVNFSSWAKIVDGRELRNIITHSNGRIETDRALSLARRNRVLNDSNIEILSVRTLKQVHITHEYSKLFLNTVQRFFKNLYSDIEEGNHL